jgi:hypothetical protein
MQTTDRRPSGQLPITATLLAALLAHPAADAALDARAELTVRKLPVGSPVPVTVFQDTMQDLDPTGSFAGAGFRPDLLYVEPSTGATARYGALRAGVHADANYPGGAVYSTASVSGSGRFTDQFSLVSPGVTGTGTMTLRGTVRAGFQYEPQGSTDTTNFLATGATWLDLFVDGVARVQDRYTTTYEARISENILPRLKVDVKSLNGNYAFVQPDSLLEGAGHRVTQHFVIEKVPFQFGRAVSVNTYLNVLGGAQACCSPGDGLDAISSAWFRWDGITDVVRSDGTPVNNFQALGAVTGFNYAQAAIVPEPGASWMLLAGLLPLLRAWRRQQPRVQA